MSGLDLARLEKLFAQATPDWRVYSEPEVGLWPALFAGTPMVSGFGPIEPLQGADLELAAAMYSALPHLIARITALEDGLRQASEVLAHVESDGTDFDRSVETVLALSRSLLGDTHER